MECNQVEADFNISQPGSLYSGYLSMYQQAISASFIAGDAYPPSIVDPLDTQIYTTLTLSQLKVNLPAGTYSAYCTVEQQQLVAVRSSILYDLYAIDGGVEEQKICSRRILTSDTLVWEQFKVVHLMTKKFTLVNSGSVELRFGTNDTYGDVKCNTAVLNVIKHNF